MAVILSPCEAKWCVCRALYIWGPGGLKFTSDEHSCEKPSMNDDVPARDAEGLTSFYAEKTVQSLYAQLGLRHGVHARVQRARASLAFSALCSRGRRARVRASNHRVLWWQEFLLAQ